MEWLQLFDINENPINKKIIRGFVPDKDEYIMIVYMFIINDEGKILLEQDADTLTWVVPGGHVDTVDPIDNIKREMMEELGININNYTIHSIKTLVKNSRLFKLFYLNGNIDTKKMVLNNEEVLNVAYYSINEIDNMINNKTFKENNIMFIEAYKEFINEKNN